MNREGLDFVILDASPRSGGAWPCTWPSLRLFSPAAYSSLPGRRMPPSGEANPDAAHVVDYLAGYEDRYDLPIRRPVTVRHVRREGEGFVVVTDAGRWGTDAVISATGTWSNPYVPDVPGLDEFTGRQTHSARYGGPERYAGGRVLVVGGANSGAQIAAELAGPCELTWCTPSPPHYLPDDVDGRELFRLASAKVRGVEGAEGVGGLGDIVVVPPVRTTRDAGLLVATPMADRFTADGVAWDDGSHLEIDDVIWCTGFRPALGHLRALDAGFAEPSDRIATDGPAVIDVPGLYLLGYGDWCGPASATLVGVGQWARAAVTSIAARLGRSGDA